MNLFIIDGIAPFFRGYNKDVINWSKIPFTHLEKENSLDSERCEQIIKEFPTFCQKASESGYNAITLDDLAHLCLFPFYPRELNCKLKEYRHFFSKLFGIAKQYHLKTYITTDLLFYNDAIDTFIGKSADKTRTFAASCCQQLLERFPEISGIIVRIGESDGIDVTGDFQSKLTIRTPKQARQMLEALLPIFEMLDKQLIFRTWSVGVGRIGDMIWNPKTFDAVFNGLESPNLIISMKHGQSDFFRYLPINPLFSHSQHQKIVEFQARREYEGFGEYPSFIGWDYKKTRKILKNQNIIGISVWCQTGGWSGFRRLTWLDKNAVWNEINAFVIIKLFKEQLSLKDAIKDYAKRNNYKWKKLRKLLKLSDEVIKELLYIEDFASRHMFFRRLRVPPLVTVYWWHITANHFMRKLMRHFVSDEKKVIQQGYNALDKIKTMQKLARKLGLPEEDIQFQYDTFKIMAAVREYYFMPFDPAIIERLKSLKDDYEKKYPDQRYKISLDFSRVYMRSAHLAFMLKIFFRGKHDYRLFDRIVTLNLLSLLYPIIKRTNKKMLPDFAKESAMGFDSIFK